jgi:FKBP12-rapamycin complex-associated protein
LLQFVRRCADHFLTSEQQEVRLEAVRTCSRLLRLALQGSTTRHSDTVTTTVADVLGKLLVVGITDTGESFMFFHVMYVHKFSL